MGIMDVLAQLEGPEYDEPAPLPTDREPQDGPAQEALPPDTTGSGEPPVQPQAQEPERNEEPQEPLPAAQEAPQEDPPRKKPRRIRAEWIMGIIAGLAGIALVVTVLLSRPYFSDQPSGDEDPMALQKYHQDNFEPLQITEAPEQAPLDPTGETEPRETTIPPDRNPYDQYDFQYNRHNYLLLQNVKSYAGVDVSAYQGDIDWKKVKQSGIDFAMIRLGYRGYESGKLVEDDYAIKNLEGAREAGLRVGAYFFSQAIDLEETEEEIDFILELLDGFELDMPIVLDWEIPTSTARTAKMDKISLTNIQLRFCGKMRELGFQPMIYFNWHQSENLYDLYALESYPFWLALYQERMTYPWKVEMWQYTNEGKVPGINGPVDLNVYMPD